MPAKPPVEITLTLDADTAKSLLYWANREQRTVEQQALWYFLCGRDASDRPVGGEVNVQVVGPRGSILTLQGDRAALPVLRAVLGTLPASPTEQPAAGLGLLELSPNGGA